MPGRIAATGVNALSFRAFECGRKLALVGVIGLSELARASELFDQEGFLPPW